MKTHLNRKARVLSVAMAMAIMINALPMNATAIFIESISGIPPSQPTEQVSATVEGISGTPMNQSTEQLSATVESGNQMPGSVDQITLPTNDKNPYSPEISIDAYPIFNDIGFDFISGKTSNNYIQWLQSYAVHNMSLEGYSPYYTASITPWFSYIDAYDKKPEGTLPYREGVKEMLFPGMVLTDTGIIFYLGPNSSNDIESDSFKDLTSSYITDRYGIDKSQAYVRVGATLLSGSGIVDVATGSRRYSVYKSVQDNEPIEMYVDVPLKELDSRSTAMINCSNGSSPTDGVITDIYVTLIDNQSPSLQSAKLDMVVNEDTHRADLVVEMQFNEGLRFAADDVSLDLDNMWIELELIELDTNNKQTARLYIEKLESGGKLVFRGDIGYYHYKNFRVTRISKVNLSHQNRNIQRGLIDLANEFYAGAYYKLDYDNRIFKEPLNPMRFVLYFDTTGIIDHAGNPISEDSIVNWQFGDQRFISNTIEAAEVRLFNEITLKNAEALAAGDKVEAELTDQFVGPTRGLIAYVYMKQKLTAEEASKLSITFNILDKDGNPVTATATSWSEYNVEELYSYGSSTGTLVMFDNVWLTEGMAFADGADVSTVRIVDMHIDVPDKTAYHHLPDPVFEMYADFDAPVVTMQKYASYSNVEDGGGGYGYKVSIKIGVKDDDHMERYADLIGSKMFLMLGAGVEQDTKVRYVFGSDPIAPDRSDGYTNEANLSKNGYVDVGSQTLLNSYTESYLHLLFDTTDVALDDLFVNVHVEDAVGNRADVDPTGTIDYMVDTVAPAIQCEYKTSKAIEENTQVEMKIGIAAYDLSEVVRLLYAWSEDGAQDIQWNPVVIQSGSRVTGEITRVFGNELPLGGADEVYRESLWIKAIDKYGNESLPMEIPIALSTEKPLTNMRFSGDYNAVRRDHSVIVIGPDPSALHHSDAYTRVTVTPLGGGENGLVTSYVTLVKTGEEIDLLRFTGMTWYKVTRVGDIYTGVSESEYIGEDYVLSKDSIMYGLFTHYGEIKISFENGYGSMMPIQGETLYSIADAGSYYEDPNYLTLRFASPYDTDRVIHGVDFGAIVDRDDKVVMQNADKGTEPYLYYADTRGVNPMRNSQIHFKIFNLANAEYGMLDLDYEGSYAELYRVGENGEPDRLMSKVVGLSASDDQYFTIMNTDDNGEYFPSGAYYLKVTVKSRGGHPDVYESARVVLDAEIAESSGIWHYSIQGYSTIESIVNEQYFWTNYYSDEKPFDNIGVSVTVGGEILRNRMFASYSYGASGISIILSAPDSEKTYEGITVGKVTGYRLWNLLSDPTDLELASAGFRRDGQGDYVSATNGLSEIYTAETIPKGAAGFEELYLVKGTNTICYQVLMENGYVSPIRQFNIVVSEYTPELNVAIESYQLSHEQSDNPAILNVDHIRYFIESAYSLNGSGNVSVEIWSDYGMYVGIQNGEEFERIFVDDPTDRYSGQLGLLNVPRELKVGDYVELTENSYTSDFPKYTNLCTAVFVVRDEYGGVTIVAPQIGDQRRVAVSGSIYGWEVYRIDYYGSYYDDPYLVDDDFLSWRRIYNQPSYFGKQLLGFESYIEKNSESGGEKYREITNGAASLEYNLFNIVTNDISWGLPEESSRYDEFGDAYYQPYSHITYADGNNYELIYWDSATISFTGGDLGDEEVTLDLRSGDIITTSDDGEWTNTPNTIGYLGASVYTGSDGLMRFAFDVAYPRANASNPAGTQVKRQYVIRCHNKYGDSYEIEGSVTLYYITYDLEVHMEDHGAELALSFLSKESGEVYRTGHYNNGVYTVALTDHYGNKVELSYAVADGFDSKVEIALSEFEKTPGPVIVTLHSPDGLLIRADVTDHAIMSVEGNDSDCVTVTLRDSTSFSYRYIDSDSGDEVMRIVSIENIKKPNPKIVWSYDEGSVLEDENGNRYKYGEVTAYLVDENYVLVDRLTGKTPRFTFIPGGVGGYSFVGAQIKATMGAYEIDLEQDYTAMLSIQLKEFPDPLGFNVEDNETPSVQILAYAEQNGYYLNANLALRLEAVRGMSNLPTNSGYTVLDFSGDRLNVQRALDALGWGTAFRFEIQTDDGSRVKLFIKEGIYAEAPDYHTGYSDTIPGVELNSKLLTVSRNAAFSLFVVDAHNNSTSIAFDVNNIGEAPAPKVIKVDKGGGVIRGYLFPPEGASNFAIVGVTGVKIDSDSSTDSEYFGKYYVEYEKNDDYVINYRFDYNGKSIVGEIRVSVTEITLDEIALIDASQPIWSTNKSFEATPFAVTATATMTKEIKDIRINGAYDQEKVTFLIANNVLTVTFLENHPPIEILCFDAADNHVTVRIDGVENIDKNAPVIKEIGRVLATNGKSLLITFSSNERALFKEGGYVGEQGTDEYGNTVYYYTRTILQNGSYGYSFVDMSGLVTQIEITVSEIISEPLEALYSTSFEGTSPTSDPSALDVMIGDKIFVKTNRDALLEMTGGLEIRLAAGVWSEITVPDALGGLHPYVIISDPYGNVLTHQFSSIKVPDTTPPEIVVAKKIYSVRIGSTREEIEAALLSNFDAFDDMGGEVTRSVKFTQNIDVIGVTEVEYTAIDSEGNRVTQKEKLRITSIYEPVVRYGEVKLDRGDGVIVSADEELIMNIDCNGMPFMVRIKAGNRTEAQMKDGSTVVTDYITGGTVSFGMLEKGIYTICIVTQERDYFKIIISVE